MPEDTDARLRVLEERTRRLDSDIGRAARKSDEVEARAKERVDEVSRGIAGELTRIFDELKKLAEKTEANTEFRNRMIGIGIAIGFTSGTVAGLISALIMAVLG